MIPTPQNAAVFPEEPASRGFKWHHKPAGELVSEYKTTAQKTYGFDPTMPQKATKKGDGKHPVAKPVVKTAPGSKLAKATSHAAAPHKKAAPAKPTAREEAASEEKKHAELSDEVWGKPEADVKWQHKGAAAELAHISKAVSSAEPVAPKAAEGEYKETAAQMEARHAKETTDAFPARWFAAKKQSSHAKAAHTSAEEYQNKRAVAVGSAVFGKHAFRQMSLQNKLAQDENQVAAERKVASDAADSELSGLKKLSDEVFPAEHKPLKSTKKAVIKHAVHKQAMKAH